MTDETSPALTDPDAVDEADDATDADGVLDPDAVESERDQTDGLDDGPGPATSLYGWLWRLLPGGRLLKLFITLLIVAAVVLVLFSWVFPWLEPRLPWVDVTVGDPGAGG